MNDNFKMTNDKFNEVSIDLLIDILATNMDIIDKLNAMGEFTTNPDVEQNRVLILQYLSQKYGELPESLSELLKNKGINKDDKK